ncbi:prolyl oligopeptidase family serine peptidase [Nesterenkonia aerolata]|uniref:Prolyl oligopeptidase family serine peptidase n=1 Tax=Nesterenkonia aerolata TaxID=3074079 RepID=A0ABU2DP33_9MICC|nr:prolyl oligopeptidase family serine peptidase [Nesterenkonia sp. LY-0111]MDR8018209.1 prolyl oligopeptidase family serine peptidase [Nesterenkonia sp. LY-0111]
MTTHLPSVTDDPHLWLEDVTSEEALDWVRRRNARAEAELIDEEFAPLEGQLREILDATDRIPGVVARGEHLYNFWTDADHPQGLWRRTTWESYRTEDPDWEILLDVDALSAQDSVTWVWHGASVLRPQDPSAPYRHALISLSRGGSDADITYEFDLHTGQFVPESEGGFVKPEGKGSLSWIDADTVYAAVDAPGTGDDGEAVTSSGYPRLVRRWSRGTALEDAPPVVAVGSDDMVAGAGRISTPGYERDLAVRVLSFYEAETYLITQPDDAQPGGAWPELTRIDVPLDCRTAIHRDLLVLMPRSDAHLGGVEVPGGGVAVVDLEGFLIGEAAVQVLFAPTAATSLQGVITTRRAIVLTVMEDVVQRPEVHFRRDGAEDSGEDGAGGMDWVRHDVFTDQKGTLSIAAVDSRESDQVWLTVQDQLTPVTLHLGDLAPLIDADPGGETLEPIKQAPARFDATGLSVTQRFATSDDGTSVPYFLIGPAETLTADEPTPRPTVLYGYGGFEISQTPSYLGLVGKAWLERGGVFVVANIRGGGEYGPRWHQAALREKRHRAYEDFAAVARELVASGVTTVPQLACRGGSNGGLLTGNMLTQYPELFGAVVIQVPLLDMKRYAHLLAGASWRAEYGDPETDDWEFLRTFSPYHLLSAEADYPAVLLTTSTRDDRVHPGHARKMTAALEELGADVRYWENMEGGHGGAATPAQQARLSTFVHRFLAQQLGLTPEN